MKRSKTRKCCNLQHLKHSKAGKWCNLQHLKRCKTSKCCNLQHLRCSQTSKCCNLQHLKHSKACEWCNSQYLTRANTSECYNLQRLKRSKTKKERATPLQKKKGSSHTFAKKRKKPSATNSNSTPHGAVEEHTTKQAKTASMSDSTFFRLILHYWTLHPYIVSPIKSLYYNPYTFHVQSTFLQHALAMVCTDFGKDNAPSACRQYVDVKKYRGRFRVNPNPEPTQVCQTNVLKKPEELPTFLFGYPIV